MNNVISELYGVKILSIDDPEVFRSAMDVAISNRKHDGLQVDVFELSFYKKIIDDGGWLFLSEDNLFGIYVSSEGEIGSLFKNRKSKTVDVASFLLQLAIKYGGRYFNAYGTPHLEYLYVNNGFNPVVRMKFSEDLAPVGWQKTTLKHKPDVIFFVYSPRGVFSAGCGVYIDDWQQAYDYMISLSKTLSYELP